MVGWWWGRGDSGGAAGHVVVHVQVLFLSFISLCWHFAGTATPPLSERFRLMPPTPQSLPSVDTLHQTLGTLNDLHAQGIALLARQPVNNLHAQYSFLSSTPISQQQISTAVYMFSVPTHTDRCWICDSSNEKLRPTPETIRLRMFCDKNLWVSKDSTVCDCHMHGKHLHKNINIAKVKTQLTYVPVRDISELVGNLMQAHFLHSNIDSKFSFEDDSLTDMEYWTFTGLKKEDFNRLHGEIANKIRTSSNRSSRDALGIFMMKLRTGISHSELAGLFRVKKHVIHECVRHVREVLVCKDGFVQKHLGVHHVSREQIINEHTTTFARTLFGQDRVILVEDGTYIYIQKSADYLFARHTLSGHKHRYLIKPMVCCATDGYFIDIFGPYLADQKNSDAFIFKHQHEEMIQTDVTSLRKLVRDGDIYIVDRGFRGTEGTVSGVDIQYPAFDDESGQQDTKEANRTRKVTKIRWVVESANCRLKQFKFLARVVTNTQLRFVGDYCRIVAAICNAYRPPLAQNHPKHADMAQRMSARLGAQNELRIRCQKGGDLHSKSAKKWVPMKCSHVPGFPLLSEADIEEHLTFGCYQIKQARSYINEHLDEHGEFELQRAIYEEESFDESERKGKGRKRRRSKQNVLANIVHTKLQSRHYSDNSYHVYIEFDPSRTGAPWDKIVAWYCTCACGSRTLGC
jgi:hypothetical protein